MQETGTGSQRLATFPGIAAGAIVRIMIEMNRYITPDGTTPVQI